MIGSDEALGSETRNSRMQLLFQRPYPHLRLADCLNPFGLGCLSYRDGTAQDSRVYGEGGGAGCSIFVVTQDEMDDRLHGVSVVDGTKRSSTERLGTAVLRSRSLPLLLGPANGSDELDEL